MPGFVRQICGLNDNSVPELTGTSGSAGDARARTRRPVLAGVSFVPDFTFDGVTFDGRTVYKEVGGEELMILPRVDAQEPCPVRDWLQLPHRVVRSGHR